jgi:peptidoglycan/LPS O-acetylase OafA/YrhL
VTAFLELESATRGCDTFALALLFTPLISRAARGYSGVLGVFFTLTPILYIGRISYGIYLYHLPIKWVIEFKAFKWISGLPWFIPHATVFFVATVLMAAFSWHFFERPINQLKRLFPYRATTPDPRVEMELRAIKR